MPKNVKRRVPEMPTEEERQPSKRQRNSSSSRRYSKWEDEFQQKRCLTWFKRYSTPEEPEVIGPDGIGSFCDEISVAPENVAILVLAYKMGARQMGFLTQNEWLKGMMELQCDTIPKLQNKIEYLRNLLNDPTHFKSIYRYAYDFARDKDQRSMDAETAKGMLELLLGKQWPLFEDFVRFLDQSKYKVINKDQWSNVLEFSRTINMDLTNYDVDGAWPVLLDEFVEWMRHSRSSGGNQSVDADSTTATS